MIRTIFQPLLSVREDGYITIDLDDIQGESLDENSNFVDPPEDDKGYATTATILDRVMGHGSEVEQLRKLADYIEKQDKEERWTALLPNS